MFKIWKADGGYENNLTQYSKTDGILSLLLFGVMIVNYALLAVLQTRFVWMDENMWLACGFNVFMTAIAVLFVKLRKQSLETIGLLKGRWKSSIAIGVILASILFYNNCLSHVIAGSALVSIQKIGTLFVYDFFVSVCEEVVFRGYIGTRICGLVKKRWLAVCVTGLLFIVMHFSYRMIAYGMTLSDLTIHHLGWMADLFITHVVLQLIYLKTNSLYGAVIPHWMSNFANQIVMQ